VIPRYESISVIEKFFGEPLSKEIVRRFKSMPNYQLEELCIQMDANYLRWYHTRIRAIAANPNAGGPDLPAFMPVYSYRPQFSGWQAEFEHWLKCSLLYFPGRIEIPDPIGWHDHLYDLRDALRYRRAAPDLERAREQILEGLPTLLTLRPLIDNGSLSTIPEASIRMLSEDSLNMNSSWQDPDDLPNLGIPEIRDRLIELEHMRQHVYNAHINVDNEWWFWDIATIWLWIGLCLDNSPVAADSVALSTLERDFRLNTSTAVQDQRVARLISHFQIPAADNAPLDDVVRMRLNEEAFYEFRSSFDNILQAVTEANPRSDEAFSREFKRHAYDELASHRARVTQDIKTSERLRQMLSGIFLLGAAGVEAAVTHDAPIGTLLAGAAGGGGWLIPYLIRRSKSRKAGELTRMFFSSLIRPDS
jgi:hypothetical protein